MSILMLYFKNKAMRIIGIDPGIGRTGWAIIEEENGKCLTLAYDCIETPAGEQVEKRLDIIFNKLNLIIHKYHPEVLAMEDLFFNDNAKTAFVVGQARGVIMLAAYKGNMAVEIYTPLQVKMALTGYGRADKKEMAKMVGLILKLKTLPKIDDTIDALAIALTHSFSRRIGVFRNKK